MTFKPVLILAVSLLAFCVGEPECGPNKCKDLWTAKKCGSVKHCIAGEWLKIEPTKVRDDVCAICLKMVKEARDTLRSNETRDALKEVLEGSCHLLEFKPAVRLCDQLMDELVPELVDTLSSQMDPEAVCSIAKLCNNAEFWNAHKNSKECAHCEAFTETADKEIKSVSSEQFRNGILGVCRSAGTFSDACAHIGMEFSEGFHKAAKNILSNKPCEAVSLCPTNSKTEVFDSQLRVRIKNQMCPLCKTVLRDVREKLLRVRSAEEFSEKMAQACETLKLSNNTCSVLSSPSFYEKLKSSEELPNLFCSLTYCMEKPKEEFPVWPLLPSHLGSFKPADNMDILELLENLEMFFPAMKQEQTETPRPVISYGDRIEHPIFFAPSLFLNDVEDCNSCTEIVDILSGTSEKDFGSACSKAKNPESCKRFVDKFSPVLNKAVAERIFSKKMCRDLIPSCQPKDEVPASLEGCSFCMNAMRVLKYGNSVSKTGRQNFWGRLLEDKCNEMHENSKDKCKNLSSLFLSFPAVLKNSTKEIEACSQLKMCEQSAVELYSSADGEDKTEGNCQDCLLAVQAAQDALKNNASDVYIQQLLESMCNALPQYKKMKCLMLVQFLGVEGLKQLIESLSPAEVCMRVHLCGRRIDLTSAQVVSTKVEEKVPCKFCLMAIKMLIDELEDSRTEETIRKALNNLCKYFPEETRDTCKNLIDEYAEDIIDMIVADFNATEICTYLKICPVASLFENTLGTDVPVFDVETNELRDKIENLLDSVVEEFSPRVGIVKLDEPKQEDLFRFRKVVQECALCEAIVGVISSHKKMLSKDYDFASNARFICSIVPADKRKECMSMATSYGPSIVNLIVGRNVDPNFVCLRLDLCDPDMQAKVNQPVSMSEDKIDRSEESNDCMLGPVFWCANAENAEKCGTFLHCQETVWKNWETPPTRTSQQ